MSIYFHLVSALVRSQMQYRLSFAMDVLTSVAGNAIEFAALAAVFGRFGNIGGWSLGEVAFLYGMSEIAFGTMDMVFGGFDPANFSTLIERGTFDQLLIRPLPLALQVMGSDFQLRRLGRIGQGAAVLMLALVLTPISWTVLKVLYLPIVYGSAVLLFGALFVAGATVCFWTVQSIEVVNLFTYGGTTMMSYPMHIYNEWMRRIFTFVVPAALVVYYPALYFLDKADPFGLPSWMSFLAPAAGVGSLAFALAAWQAGARHYQSTGT